MEVCFLEPYGRGNQSTEKSENAAWFSSFLYLIQSGVMLSRFLGLIECSYWSDLGVWFRQVLAVKMQSEKKS